MLCEIGGTVGDIESLPFLEAIRQIGNELGRERALFVHLTLVPWIPSAGELKTKPTQHSVKELLGLGIQPDILLCRCDRPIPERRAQEDRAVLQPARVAGHPGARRRHHLRGARCLSCRGLRRAGLRHFGIAAPQPELARWHEHRQRASASPRARSTSPIVGKYTHLLDSYKSLAEALTHGGIANNVRVKLDWIDSRDLRGARTRVQYLEGVHGILVPGGFGERGAEGKILAARFARERQVPYFGICFGMQMAVIEAARHLAGLPGAGSTEFGPCEHPVIGLMTEWVRGNVLERAQRGGDLGGTMRLGAYDGGARPGQPGRRDLRRDADQRAAPPPLRGQHQLHERARGGRACCSPACRPTASCPRSSRSRDHPWFIGVQFHPELKSKPFEPHPLFTSFIRAALDQARLV